MHVIAAKAVAFKEALDPNFISYQKQVISNAKHLSECLASAGFKIVSGGTDTHLILIDLSNKNITGKAAEEALDLAGITVNKNTVPFETRSPFVTSGIRIGTPALTTRGMKNREMGMIADMIVQTMEHIDDPVFHNKTRENIREFCEQFPLYAELTNKDQSRMKCPACSNLENRVIDSRLNKEGNSTRRRRECLSCNERFTTYERVEKLSLIHI